MNRWMKVLSAGFFSAMLLTPAPLWACAACYGQSDSALANGMNWGIFSLLAVVATVLGTITSFFVYIGRKSAAAEINQPADAPAAAPTEKD